MKTPNLMTYFCIVIFLVCNLVNLCSTFNVYYMLHDKCVTCTPRGASDLQIFCYDGSPKSLVYLWRSVLFNVKHPSNTYNEYIGWDPESVTQEYNENKNSWSYNIFSYKSRSISLDPFNKSCIGIESKEPFDLCLNIIRVDYWRIILLVIGIVVFFAASKLSTTPVFYYSCGITLGICTSFLMLIYLISKLFPKKRVMYGLVACGWTIGIYMIQVVIENLRLILTVYKTYLMAYTILTGAISFIICYRLGPVENERTKNLMRWFLQFLGLVAVFYSSHYYEASIGQILLLLTWYIFPKKWVWYPINYWRRKFPQKIVLLNNDEYYEQGVRETAKSLEQLRVYCSSPQCNQWKMATKLKDVKRFASFVEGDSHLSDNEILEYETSLQQSYLTEDEDESDY